MKSSSSGPKGDLVEERTQRTKRRGRSSKTLDSIPDEHQLMINAELNEALRFNPIAMREREELSACAYLGYIEAKKRFDPRRGKSFYHFARRRIRGAIFDGLADLSPLGRSALRAVKRHVQLQAELTEQTANVEQSHLGLSSDDQRNESKTPLLSATFLERYKELYQLALSTWAEELQPLTSPDPSLPYQDQAELAEERSLLSAAFDRLDDAHKELLTALYDLRRVGESASVYAERHQVHRSTVSRRHASAILALRREVTLSQEQRVDSLDQAKGDQR